MLEHNPTWHQRYKLIVLKTSNELILTTTLKIVLQVFTKNHTDGHGRAADIWSVGCVVIEMASGKVFFK